MSLRSEPSACASDTSAVTRRSNARRRASALPLHLGVAAHAQQQRHVRELVDEHVHGAAQHEIEPVGGAAGRGIRLLEHALERS